MNRSFLNILVIVTFVMIQFKQYTAHDNCTISKSNSLILRQRWDGIEIYRATAKQNVY